MTSSSTGSASGRQASLIGGKDYEWADDAAAVLAAGIILFNAYRLILSPLHDLMEKEPTELVDRLRAIAGAVPGVEGVEKVFACKSGTRYWVDMHIEVEPAMTVLAGHSLAHRVKEEICSLLSSVADVLIHIERFGSPGPRSDARGS